MGSCGAFVHGLEDEFLSENHHCGVCISTVYSVQVHRCVNLSLSHLANFSQPLHGTLPGFTHDHTFATSMDLVGSG